MGSYWIWCRYKPVTIYATVPKEGAEVVDFKLTRVHSEPKGQAPEGPEATQDPSEQEFQSFIKDLSLGHGLEELVSSTATKDSLRYRKYKGLSQFLRGLHLNFPRITSLHRLAKSVFLGVLRGTT